jgi:hypothetical protein
MSKEISNAMDDFEAELLENEVVVTHVGEGHNCHFPILTNGAVGLAGSLIEPNPRQSGWRGAFCSMRITPRAQHSDDSQVRG